MPTAPTTDVADFARVLFERTAGNPFFVTQVLRKLHRDQAITFNQTARCFQVAAQALDRLLAADPNLSVARRAMATAAFASA